MNESSTTLVPVTPPASYPQYRPVTSLKSYVPMKDANKYWHFADDAAKLGLALIAASGTGKSRLFGRTVAIDLMKAHKPLVILDPTGGTIDNCLDVIARKPLFSRKALWSRITYVDCGSTDYRLPQPLYYRLGERDTLFEIANRFPSVLKRQDPDLTSAPILGWNSLYECAINAGMIGAALGRQLDFVADLVRRPEHYKEDLRQALAINPIVAPAVEYFRELMDPSRHSLREKRTGSFLTKLLPFISDPLLLASFSGKGKGIDWEQAAQEGRTVLIDLRHVHDPALRQFSMLWYFRSFTDYIKQRGMAGRDNEILLMIDELADMLAHQDGQGRSLLAQDLEELAARHARNYGVNLVLALQSLASVEPGVQNVLMQLGTQVIGRIANHDDALTLAKTLLIYDPFRVKKTENVWGSVSEYIGNGKYLGVPTVIDYRTHEYTIDEQIVLLADHLKQLPRFEFILRTATAEGLINHQVRKISIANFYKDEYPAEPYTAYIRSLLRQACGIPVKELLAEINQRRPAVPLEQKPAKKPSKAKALATDATMKGTPAHDTSHPVPRPTRVTGANRNGTTTSQTPKTGEQDDIFGEI